MLFYNPTSNSLTFALVQQRDRYNDLLLWRFKYIDRHDSINNDFTCFTRAKPVMGCQVLSQHGIYLRPF